jgi:DNA-binding IclR family transcriptional regulator
MLAIPTVLKNLVLDQDLIPRDTQIFIVASQFLDDDEFRPLKLRTIAQLLGMTISPVHAAMRRLTEQGYIERGPRKARGPVTFRIPPHLTAIDARGLSRIPPGGTPHETQALASATVDR